MSSINMSIIMCFLLCDIFELSFHSPPSHGEYKFFFFKFGKDLHLYSGLKGLDAKS